MKPSNQYGMNSLLMVFVLVMLGFLLTCFFKLGPAYLDNMYIKDALKNLAQDHPIDLATLNKDTIRRELGNYYLVNNVRGEAANTLDVERKGDRSIISVNYEVRVSMIGNIDAVLKFDNVLDSSRPEECCKLPKDQRK